MDTYDFDIYEEYPELRDLKPRRTSGGGGGTRRKKRKLKNSVKFCLLLIILAAVFFVLLAVVPNVTFGAERAVYSKNGEVAYIKEAELEEYLADGWYAAAADIVPVTLYAEDGSSVTAVAGDVAALEEQGYYADKSAAFTAMYSEDGGTLYVPNSKASAYKAIGWTDDLSDVTKTLYKSDGSKIVVPNGEADKYLSEGWTDKLLEVAKKMISEEGEEKFVFNNEVDSYLAEGWTVAKRAIDPNQPMIALTFDDGPGKYTDTLLDCLEENNSVATFYVLGERVELCPDTIKRQAELGCEVSNHTWDHVNLTTVSAEEAADTIKKTSDAVEQLTGKPTPSYRPCYGSYNDTVLGAIDLPAVMWTVDTLDWETKNADSTYDAIMSKAYDGAIILMHDIHESTVEAACRAIPELIEEGYQLVTVSELLQCRLGGAESGEVYFDAEKD